MYALISFIAIFFLFGCGSGNESQYSEIQTMTFVDKGAVAEYPTITTITIDQNSITKTEAQSGVIFGKWTKEILMADYISLRNIITDKNLMNESDITLAPGQEGCSGWRGMAITIQTDGPHHFDIDGAACDMSKWPAGVHDLVIMKDSIAAAYFCGNPVPVRGQWTPKAPGYIIYFKSGVNAVTETKRLALLYGFNPNSIFDMIGGFYAELSPDVLEPIRCEPTINEIYFDEVLQYD